MAGSRCGTRLIRCAIMYAVSCAGCSNTHCKQSVGHLRVAPLVKEVQGELVLGVDDPDKQEATSLLELRNRQAADIMVCSAQGNN